MPSWRISLRHDGDHLDSLLTDFWQDVLHEAVGARIIGDTIENQASVREARYQVLVVDDMSEIQTLLTRMLERLGHTVQAVSSGELALAVLDEFPAEIIFSDISMPHMNGYELVRALRRRPDTRDRYIIAMSATSDAACQSASLAAGFDAYLPKPFEME